VGIPIPVEPTLDERTATAAADRAQKLFADAGRDAGRQFSEAFTSGAKNVDDDLRKMAEKASDAYDKARDAAGKLRAEEEKLKRLREQGASSDRIVAQAEKVEAARRAETRAIRDATNAYRDYERAAERAGQGFLNSLGQGDLRSAGRDAASEFAEGFAGSSKLLALGASGGPIGLALAGIAAVGVAAGRALAGGIAEGMQSLQMQDLISARTGLDPVNVGRLADAAGAAYANGFGASLEDNLRAIQFSIQGGVLDPNAGDVEVRRFVERLQTVSSVIEEDPGQIARGVRNFLKTGLVSSYDAAFDLIVAATQRGLNISNDLLDTLEEYGTKFRDLGISGVEALGLINQMWQGGARNVDVAADALKEFAISVVDSSDTTATALTALGFNAEDMADKFAQGGPAARAAFGAVLDAINSIEDPMERERIGLDLFKTKWEDVGDAIHNLDLSAAAQEFGDLSNATDSASDALSRNVSGWTELKRNIDETFRSIKEWLADSTIGRFFSQGLPSILNAPFDRLQTGTSGFVHADAAPPAPVSPTDVITGATPGLPPGASAPRTPQDLLLPGVAGPAPQPGQIPGAPAPPPDRGPGMPYDDAKRAIEDAKKGDGGGGGSGGKGKPSFDPSLWSVDAIPVPGSLPVDPATGMPIGAAPPPQGNGPGYYQVDPQRVFDAETSVLSARKSVEQARLRVLELEASGTATQQELIIARDQVTMAERQYISAQMKLAEAQRGTWKQMESTAKQFAQGMDQIGAALDNDLGISEGLPGLAENLVKFLASLAAAPLLGPLSAIAAANPIQGGHGLMGILGAQGVFGPPQVSTSGASAMGPAALQPPAAYMPMPTTLGAPGSYGLPAGTQIAYGQSAQFPAWVRAIEQAFGIQASTYPGHQESHRNEPGYAPNPNRENRGIDWSGPVENMQRFADYLATIPGALEQVIWQNPKTGRSVEIAGGRPQPGYFAGDLAAHTDHVHTRQSMPIPLPGLPQLPAAAPSSWSPTYSAPASGGLIGAATPPAPALPTYAPGAGGMLPGGGMPQAFMPSSGPQLTTPIGGVEYPAPGGGGFGGIGGMPLDALMASASSLDALAPGASQAIQMGIQLANRGIAYAGQMAGIGVSGLIETFLPAGSPLASIGNSWLGRIAAGFAGARPALPNLAGLTATQPPPPNPNAANQQQQQGSSVGTNIEKLEYHNHQASEDRAGADLTRHLSAQHTPAGIR